MVLKVDKGCLCIYNAFRVQMVFSGFFVKCCLSDRKCHLPRAGHFKMDIYDFYLIGDIEDDWETDYVGKTVVKADWVRPVPEV